MLIPRGKKRTMFAQNYLPGVDLPQEVKGLEEVEPTIPEPSIPAMEGEESVQDSMEEIGVEPTEEVGDNDVLSYVLQKMEAFGYPARRLDQYEDNFVKEELFPDGGRNVTIVMPDRYYGKKQRISQKDIKVLIQEMQSQFGLAYTGGEREDKKVTFNFQSEHMAAGEEDDEFAGDVLEEVFGGPSEEKDRAKRPKRAENIISMMKEARTSFENQIIADRKVQDNG